MSKQYKSNHEKEHKKQLHCPTCNRYIKYIAGQDAYICTKCVELATDKDGKAVMFKTITGSGIGTQGVYRDTGKLYRSTLCYIKGIKCQVEDANIEVSKSTLKAKKKP